MRRIISRKHVRHSFLFLSFSIACIRVGTLPRFVSEGHSWAFINGQHKAALIRGPVWMRRALDTDTLSGPHHTRGFQCTMRSTVGPLPPGKGGHRVPRTHRRSSSIVKLWRGVAQSVLIWCLERVCTAWGSLWDSCLSVTWWWSFSGIEPKTRTYGEKSLRALRVLWSSLIQKWLCCWLDHLSFASSSILKGKDCKSQRIWEVSAFFVMDGASSGNLWMCVLSAV